MLRARSNLAWLAIVTVLAGALLIGAFGQRGARTPDERVERVAATIKCPTCVGQSVAQSEAPASRDIRADIARRITLGESDDQIRQEMASRFGPDILLSPSHDGIVGLVWIIPILMLAAVAAGLVLAFRRWRMVASGIVTDADRVLIAKAFERLEAGDLDHEQVDLRG